MRSCGRMRRMRTDAVDAVDADGCGRMQTPRSVLSVVPSLLSNGAGRPSKSETNRCGCVKIQIHARSLHVTYSARPKESAPGMRGREMGGRECVRASSNSAKSLLLGRWRVFTSQAGLGIEAASTCAGLRVSRVQSVRSRPWRAVRWGAASRGISRAGGLDGLGPRIEARLPIRPRLGEATASCPTRSHNAVTPTGDRPAAPPSWAKYARRLFLSTFFTFFFALQAGARKIPPRVTNANQAKDMPAQPAPHALCNVPVREPRPLDATRAKRQKFCSIPGFLPPFSFLRRVGHVVHGPTSIFSICAAFLWPDFLFFASEFFGRRACFRPPRISNKLPAPKLLIRLHVSAFFGSTSVRLSAFRVHSPSPYGTLDNVLKPFDTASQPLVCPLSKHFAFLNSVQQAIASGAKTIL